MLGQGPDRTEFFSKMAAKTGEESGDRRCRNKAWRYYLGMLIGLVSVLPLISTYYVKSPYFISSEFIGYRVGHSIMLQSGESEYVRPVQGIPTATLTRAILAATPEVIPGYQISSVGLGTEIISGSVRTRADIRVAISSRCFSFAISRFASRYVLKCRRAVRAI